MTVSQLWQNRLFAHTVGAAYAHAIERRGAARIFGRLLFDTDVDRIYRAMDIVAELPDGSAVLDVPCGGGVTTAHLRAGQRVRYVAMDISAGMLDHARRRLRPEQRDNVEFVEASIEAIPFADDEFDLCVSFNGLHCLPDPAAGLLEIARCLKPGGRFVGDFATRGQVRRADAYMVLMRASGTFGPGGTLQDARRWFTAAGLTVDELECSGAITHFAVHK
ncbi:MAG: class I SAM-dependent methyltransferase [Mycobacterium sp.]